MIIINGSKGGDIGDRFNQGQLAKGRRGGSEYD